MIEARTINKSFGAHRAVQEVSFCAPAGEITAFVGPNGAGKTTVLRMIAGLAVPDSGDVLIEGKHFAEAADPGATMGVFLSAESIPGAATAVEYLDYVTRLRGLGRFAATSALQLVGLPDAGKVKVRAMSLGMRQRLGIAAASMGDPRVLLLDEPANGLDPAGVQWFREYLVDRARNGVTVLLSSHHMAELAQVANRILMIDQGRIVAEGSVAEFVATQEAPPVFVRAADPRRLWETLHEHRLRVEHHDQGMLVFGASAKEVGRIAFAEGGGLFHLATTERSIEETYFDRLTAGTERIAAAGRPQVMVPNGAQDGQ